MVRDRLGAVPVVTQLPIGSENAFKGIVDLIDMKARIWRDETLGAEWDVVEIPADMADEAAEWREKMIEAAVELDDEAMSGYLEGNEPDPETLRRLIRKGTCEVTFYPVLCGSAFKNKGVQPLLDAVVDFLPSPVDVAAIKGIDPKTGRRDRAASRRRRAALHARLQDHERPVRRLAHLLPDLFGQARVRHHAGQHGEGEARAHRPHAADALQPARRDQGSLRRRHRRHRRPEGHHDRRHAVATS